MTKLKYLASVIAGQSPPSEDVSDFQAGLPFLQGNAEFGAESPVPRYECPTAPKQARLGDVLVSVRAPVGAVNTADQQYGIGRGLAAVRPVRIDARYLRWWLESEAPRLRGLATGTTFEAIGAADIGALEVPVGSGRQPAIADFLDRETTKIDALIEKQGVFIAHLRARTRARTDQVVGSDLQADTGLCTPRGWVKVRNKNLLVEVSELSAAGTEEPLSVSHLTGVTPRSEKSVTMIEANSYVGYKLVQPGDLVINTMWAWMGALGISRYEGLVSPAYGVYRLRDASSVNLEFLDAVYRSSGYVAAITKNSRGVWSSRLRIYPDVFLRMPVWLPSLGEQHSAAKNLARSREAVQPLVDKAERFIELAKERRAALITAAVTGQLEVGEAA